MIITGIITTTIIIGNTDDRRGREARRAPRPGTGPGDPGRGGAVRFRARGARRDARRLRRAPGVDLQVDVHEDMAAHFALYPPIYGRRTPDANIDHRRVPNLMVFFGRKGKTLPITTDPKDYRAGAGFLTWRAFPLTPSPRSRPGSVCAL